ncbi:GSCOCG00004410001-RA-CDS [Cotesia congregata]|nr:GSCOCG00004410001-RA-CDS [Cotesia congregata]
MGVWPKALEFGPKFVANVDQRQKKSVDSVKDLVRSKGADEWSQVTAQIKLNNFKQESISCLSDIIKHRKFGKMPGSLKSSRTLLLLQIIRSNKQSFIVLDCPGREKYIDGVDQPWISNPDSNMTSFTVLKELLFKI